jgi:hypothetical protein
MVEEAELTGDNLTNYIFHHESIFRGGLGETDRWHSGWF